jgi:hypothetical protein
MDSAEPPPVQPGGPSVLVEFRSDGFRQVAREDKLVAESAQAVAKAMDTIREMGDLVTKTVHSLGKKPSHVEVTFGITLDAEAGALVAKVAAGSSLQVKLSWDLTEHEPEAEDGR